jgi:hypothetical protein
MSTEERCCVRMTYEDDVKWILADKRESQWDEKFLSSDLRRMFGNGKMFGQI